MADPFGSGVAFRDILSNIVAPVAHVAINPSRYVASHALDAGAQAGVAAAPGFHDFIAGALGTPRPSVTVQLPAATPVKAGAKTPAAAAGGKAPAGGKAAAAADPLAGLGNLSFRQLLTLSQASENLAPKGTARATPAADAAGNMLLSITAPTFQNTLAAAKTDADKQKVIDNYRDQVLLPLVSHGNPMSGMFDPGGQ